MTAHEALGGNLDLLAVNRRNQPRPLPPVQRLSRMVDGFAEGSLGGEYREGATEGFAVGVKVHDRHSNTPCQTKQTPSAVWLKSPVYADNARMVNLSTVGARLAHVKETCRFPTWLAMAEALGISDQAFRHWRQRHSIASNGPLLRLVTGASGDWVAKGIGEPFPDGPIYFKPEETGPTAAMGRALEFQGNRIEELTKTVFALAFALSDELPDASKVFAAHLKAAPPEVPDGGIHTALLHILEGRGGKTATGRSPETVWPPSGPRAGVRGKALSPFLPS